MGKYKFEIQNCISVEIEAYDADEARQYLLNNLEVYADEMLGGSCYISEGKKVEKMDNE